MNRKELASKIVEALNAEDIRKSVPAQRTVFHITDDAGDKKDFVIRKERVGVKYTVDDINKVLEVCAAVVEEALRGGDQISISGFGSLHLKRRAARWAPHPTTGEITEMKEHYVVKFDPYKNLKKAAALFSLDMKEIEEKAKIALEKEALFDDESDEDVI